MATVDELPIDKSDGHLFFDFLSEFMQGILIHGWLLFWYSVLATAGYNMLSATATSLYTMHGSLHVSYARLCKKNVISCVTHEIGKTINILQAFQFDFVNNFLSAFTDCFLINWTRWV